MRLLYSSHTYLVNENQKKLSAIAARPEVDDLTLVVPEQWPDAIQTVQPHIDPDAPFSIHPTPTLLAGNEMRFMYLSRHLHLSEARPDVIVVENGAGAFAYAQFLRARNRLAPNARAVFFTWWNKPYRARRPLRDIEQWNLRQSDGAIAGNRDAERILRKQGYNGPILVLPQLGVDVDAFSPGDASALRQQLGLQHPVIGYVGRLVAEKGLRVLMTALDTLTQPYELLMLGRGPLAGELRAWGNARPAHQRLHLIDSVPHSAVAGYMRAMDIFVLPSISTAFWLEQFGHVLIEAMGCQVAVIGSSSAEIPHVIGDSGMVVPEQDAGALAGALATLLNHPDTRAALARKGRERVLALYTHEQIARQTVAFLAGLERRR